MIWFLSYPKTQRLGQHPTLNYTLMFAINQVLEMTQRAHEKSP